MKKAIKICFILGTLLVLSACNKNTDSNLTSELKENKWNVVSTNGESYTGEFSESTVSFKSGVFSRGFKYNIKNNNITLSSDKTKITYKIEKTNGEVHFVSKDKETERKFGDLTLSKVK